VTQVTGEARIDPATNRFVYLGQSLQEGRLPDYGFWIQDAWRPRSDLTINVGLRYELQQPFYAINDSYSTTTLDDVWGISGNAPTCTDVSNITTSACNLFQPGNLSGKPESQYFQLNKGTNAYNTDRNNFAPSVGVAWTPTAESGWLARFLGEPGDTVFRAGFARSYNRPGMSDFTGRLDDNPGLIITANRNESLGNLGTLPVLFRERDRLSPPAFDEVRTYPMTDAVTEDIQIFDPNLQVPYADSWTAGWQRAISRNMAVEARYVGTRSRDLWTTYNINGEVNIHENGFFEEFKLAQANLLANIAAGRGTHFRYAGPGTGTSPLPIYLAYLTGRTDAGNTGAYGSSSFASSTFYNPLAARDPNPFGAANNLDADAGRRANALAAGLAPNFLVPNPNKLGGAEIDGHGGYTDFNGGHAARAAPPDGPGLPVPGQLLLRQELRLEPLLVPRAAHRDAQHRRRGRRDPCREGHLGVGAAVRAGPPLRQQRRHGDGPARRRVAGPRHRAHPERPHGGFRQRPDGRVRRRRSAGHVQGPHRRRRARVDAPAGRD
jgi:hypothetical protein